MDLFEQVLHALEGTERSPQVWQTADGERTLERRTTGYDRWIEGANDGRLEAINALAVILEGVRESFDLDVEREIVEGWAIELRTAAESGEITARNPATLLPLRAVPEGWGWLISIDDLDALVKARGMGWSCTEIVAHLLNESRKTGGRWYDENGRPAAEYWIRGYEPESLSQEMDPALNATPAPTEAAAPAAPTEQAANRPDYDAELAALFDPVRRATLEALFPDGGKWETHTERAARNGLIDARAGHGKFNPYRAARWWMDTQAPHGWKWERCARVLANNLPPRSRDCGHLLTGDLD